VGERKGEEQRMYSFANKKRGGLFVSRKQFCIFSDPFLSSFVVIHFQ